MECALCGNDFDPLGFHICKPPREVLMRGLREAEPIAVDVPMHTHTCPDCQAVADCNGPRSTCSLPDSVRCMPCVKAKYQRSRSATA